MVFGKTLQFAYLFGIVPALMMAAVDDILLHIRRISWVVRMLIVGAIAFATALLIYGGQRTDPARSSSFCTACRAWSPPWCRHGWRTNTPSREAGGMSRDGVTQLAAVSRVTM